MNEKQTTNLQKVLDSMKVSCDNVEYGFTTIPTNSNVSVHKEVIGAFQENEGLTIIATKKYFEANNISHHGSFAKLTIDICTSLELVGLTATLAKKLTDNGISANVVAAYYHDHIFVPYDRRNRAVEAIRELKLIR